MKTKLAPIVIAVVVLTGLLSFAAGYAIGRLGQAVAALPAIPIPPGPMKMQPEPADVGTSIDPVDAGIVSAEVDPADSAENEAETETLENYKAVAEALAAENASLAEEIKLKDGLIEVLQKQIDELTEAEENPKL